VKWGSLVEWRGGWGVGVGSGNPGVEEREIRGWEAVYPKERKPGWTEEVKFRNVGKFG